MADKVTGKASYWMFNGVQFFITKYSPKVTRTLADTTDSSDYNQNIDMVQGSQIPVMLSQDVSIEGNYHLSQTNQALLTMVYSGVNAVPTVFGINSGALYGSGAFDISDFACEVPIIDTVKYTATIRSNGLFTPGA